MKKGFGVILCVAFFLNGAMNWYLGFQAGRSLLRQEAIKRELMPKDFNWKDD